jgi:hypothetical protein
MFSTKVLLQNRTYFFNVKENRMGDLYLNIVESKNRDSGGFERQSVILFAEDLQEFLKGFDDSLRVLEKAMRERKKSARRPERFGNDDSSRGDRERYGGDRERYGGDRERYGGDRERYGGERERYGGDRERYGGDRERYGGDRAGRDQGPGDRQGRGAFRHSGGRPGERGPGENPPFLSHGAPARKGRRLVAKKTKPRDGGEDGGAEDTDRRRWD